MRGAKVFGVLVAGLLVSAVAFPEDAEVPPEDQAAVEGQPPVEGPPAEQGGEPQAEAPAEQEQPVAQAEAPTQPEASPSDARDEAVFSRIKGLVKKLDELDRKNIDFPFRNLEVAIRTEFLRRTEGKGGPSWIRKNAREADKMVAFDNLDLFLNYAQRLVSQIKKKKYTPKDLEQMKATAVKQVVDDCNGKRRVERGLASIGETPRGLSGTGKSELTRRRKLVARMVAGDDYEAINPKKFEDYGKVMKGKLLAAAREYDGLAKMMGTAPSSGKKSKGKKRR